MSDRVAQPGQERPRVLLVGDVSARPYGMERALTRAGFHVLEAAAPPDWTAAPAAPPDVALVTAQEADGALATLLQALHAAWGGQVPIIVVLASPDREGPARALGFGADDAMMSPVHLAELCARVEARARSRGPAARTAGNGRVQDILLDLLGEARTARRTREVLDVLADRLARILGRWDPAIVLIDEAEREGRVVSGTGGSPTHDLRLDLDRYPEIREAYRTARPVVIEDIRTDPLFEAARRRWEYERTDVPVRAVAALPIATGERVLGVLLLRTRQPGAKLAASEEALALQLARAAARLLEADRHVPAAPEAGPSLDALTCLATPDVLDRKVREETERARRYALTFSLVLLELEDQAGRAQRLGRAAGDRLLAELGHLLQREVRASDFVARYADDEFALVLAETAAAGARGLVHRLRQRIGVESFAGLPPGEQLTVAAGIVAFPHPAVQGTEDLLPLLEAALRRAKAQSEERIGVAE